MADQWIVQRGGKNSAPISKQQLKQLAAKGKLQDTDLIAREGSTQFVPVTRVKGLYPEPVEVPAVDSVEPATAHAGQPDAPSAPGGAMLEAAGKGVRRLPWLGLGIGSTVAAIAGISAVALIPRSHNPASPNGPAASRPVSAADGGRTSTAEHPVVQAEETIGGPPVEEPADVNTSLTPDEIQLLKLASKPDQRVILGRTKEGKWIYKDPPPPRPTDDEIRKLLTRQYQAGGRGSQLALRLLALEIFASAYNVEAKEFDANLADYPVMMRGLALKGVGLGLTGQDVPPPFSPEFKALTRESTAWFDQLRKSKARQNELLLHLERAYFLVTMAVEHDLMPAMGAAPISPNDVQIRRGPGGQTLKLKYTGSRPLTNVIILSLVQQKAGRIDTHADARAMVDLFNRSFGATDEQADDAQRLLRAAHERLRMPKYASKYIKSLSSGQEFELQVGEMERGEALEGNTSTFALYCDQGRITARDTGEFPVLAEPVRPRGPNDAKTLVLDENRTVKVQGAFASSNKLRTLKRKDDAVEQVFLIDLAPGTYTFTLQFRGTEAAPSLQIFYKHYPDIRTATPDRSTVIRELHAEAGSYQIHCLCPVDDLGEFTLTIREGAAPIEPKPARKAKTSQRRKNAR